MKPGKVIGDYKEVGDLVPILRRENTPMEGFSCRADPKGPGLSMVMHLP